MLVARVAKIGGTIDVDGACTQVFFNDTVCELSWQIIHVNLELSRRIDGRWKIWSGAKRRGRRGEKMMEDASLGGKEWRRAGVKEEGDSNRVDGKAEGQCTRQTGVLEATRANHT